MNRGARTGLRVLSGPVSRWLPAPKDAAGNRSGRWYAFPALRAEDAGGGVCADQSDAEGSTDRAGKPDRDRFRSSLSLSGGCVHAWSALPLPWRRRRPFIAAYSFRRAWVNDLQLSGDQVHRAGRAYRDDRLWRFRIQADRADCSSCGDRFTAKRLSGPADRLGRPVGNHPEDA
jgi:hypothetical protein